LSITPHTGAFGTIPPPFPLSLFFSLSFILAVSVLVESPVILKLILSPASLVFYKTDFSLLVNCSVGFSSEQKLKNVIINSVKNM